MKVNYSLLVAAAIVIGITGWVVSGQMSGNEAPEAPIASDAKAPEPAAKRMGAVRVMESVAEPYQSSVLIAGRTEASRAIELRARILGRVTRISAKEGSHLSEGDVIVHFDPEDREAKREMARARIAQRETEFTAADKLATKGFQAKTTRAETYADLQEAKADLAEIEEQIRRLTIRAPFDAVLDEVQVELGDVVQSGEPVATLYDLDPILVVAQVSEHERGKLAVGRPGAALLLDGSQVSGTIRYITAAADPETRTFKVELEVPNPDLSIEQGVTAGVILPLPEVSAHKLSAGIFTLNDDGHLGVKIVDENGIVHFVQITVVDSGADWAYVTGLPDRARLITVGQEYVKDGDKVDAVPEAMVGTPEAKAS